MRFITYIGRCDLGLKSVKYLVLRKLQCLKVDSVGCWLRLHRILTIELGQALAKIIQLNNARRYFAQLRCTLEITQIHCMGNISVL